MSDHDPNREMPASEPRRGVWYASRGSDPSPEIGATTRHAGAFRRNGSYIAAAIAGVALIAAFAGSSVGQGLGHRILANVPGMTASAAPFEDGFGPSFGPPFATTWQSGLFDGAIEAFVEAHADRLIRHLSIEIDATAEQQDKLRAIVRDAVKDLLPMREKIQTARATARELLTQQTIDRAAIEKFRAEQIATHDAASKRLVQAVGDAAEVLTPEQRRKISDMLPGRGGPWGGGFWGHGKGRILIWRN
ncbi:MAG TPA: Spy/CpxP family protein refolding chaperone [Xanthobacteraceae bacterium]|jgi:Spy/CpxP family protein refolding chaperone|nr:Spy/CpxP family protein refolding chaperone [Xanthobacteraceae bacterium]